MRRKTEVFLPLLITLLLGTARILITPAWAHSEEPYHFIRVRTIWTEQDVSTIQNVEDQVRSSVMMITPAFGVLGAWQNAYLTRLTEVEYKSLRATLLMESDYPQDSSHQLPIGNTQYDEPPLYYAIVGLMVLPVKGTPLETQLMIARFGSLLLELFTIAMVVEIARVVFPDSPSLRRGLPLIIAVLPSFTVTMTMVNNTALAVMAMTLVIWRMALVLNSRSMRDLIGLALSGGVCLLSKSTAMIGLVAVFWGFLWILPGKSTSKLLILAAASSVIILIIVQPIGAQNWYSNGLLVAIQRGSAPDGNRSVGVTADDSLWQSLPLDLTQKLQGESADLSGWVRPNGSQQIVLPEVWTAQQDQSYKPLTFVASQSPTGDGWIHFSAIVNIPARTRCIAIILHGVDDSSLTYFDNIALIQQSAGSNVIANGSFERSWLSLRPAIAKLLPSTLAERNLMLVERVASFTEFIRYQQIIVLALRYIFTTFWGWFGWATPSLSVAIVAAIALTCFISIVGFTRCLFTLQEQPTKQWFLFGCLLTGACGILLALLSLEPPYLLANCDTFLGRAMPAPYYLSPATVPLILIWYVGLDGWLPKTYRLNFAAVIALTLYVIGILALVRAEIPTYLRLLRLL